jgi:uncharacterized protein YkwD
MRFVLVVLALVVTGSGLAADCRFPMPAGAGARVPVSQIDQDLFAQALLAATNTHRCRAGRHVLAYSAQLTEIADPHAAWMARTQKLTHGGEGQGGVSAKRRLRRGGLGGRQASENIAMMPRFEGPFRVIDESQCVFHSPGGRRLSGYSYAELAQDAADLFASSEKHRINLMETRVNFMGGAVHLDPTPPYCGRYYISQMFVR